MTSRFPMRTLGQTNIHITAIGLGMMEFAGGGGLLGVVFPVIPQMDKNAIVKAALDGGINWFDTAELYGNGISETSLSVALKAAGKADGDVVITTKWWPLFRTAHNIPRTIDDRLHYLGGYSISNYMIHQPFSFSSPESEMEVMADLVVAGKIRSVGVSNFSADRMRRAYAALKKRGLPLAVNQMRYSLLDRSIEKNGVLDAARELGVTIIAYTPLELGLLSGRYHRNPELIGKKPVWQRARLQARVGQTRPLIDALEEIAADHSVTPAQVALNWTVSFHGNTIVTIPGVTKARQAQEAAGAMFFNLTQFELTRLDELSRNCQ